jgi:hypothetical protein
MIAGAVIGNRPKINSPLGKRELVSSNLVGFGPQE